MATALRNSPNWRAIWLGLVLAIAGLCFGIWGWRLPTEPIYEGKRLSWWLVEGGGLKTEQLRTLGPGAVAWLGRQASQAQEWDLENLPSNDRLFLRVELWLREKFGDGGLVRSDHVHSTAIQALGQLGPEAAPAIPDLLRALRNGGSDDRLITAETLVQMGSKSWPTVCTVIREGDFRDRSTLVSKLTLRFEMRPLPSAAEYDQMVEAVISGTGDGRIQGWDSKWAAESLRECTKAMWAAGTGSADGRVLSMAEGIRAASVRLPRMKKEQVAAMTDRLGQLEIEAAAAAPFLATELSRADAWTKVHLLASLALIDPENPRWPAMLYEIRESSDQPLAEFAERSLYRAGK